jgi:diguanylate cyclase (GGDEF)-like protein
MNRSSDPFAKSRVKTYRLAIFCGALFSLFVVLYRLPQWRTYQYEIIFNSFSFITSIIMYIGLTFKKASPERVEKAIFIIYSVGLSIEVFLNQFNIHIIFNQGLDSKWLLELLFIIAFIIFPSKNALIFSLALLLIHTMIPWLTHYFFNTPATSAYFTVGNTMSSFIILILIYCLSFYKIHLMLEKMHSESLHILAYQDALTGLVNRRKLYERIALEQEHLQQNNAIFSIILLDIDHFKMVNDVHGHNMGDQVLVHVARLLCQEVGLEHEVGRWGGEEFLIILANTPLEPAKVMAERLKQCLLEINCPPLERLTASFGVTQARPQDRSEELTARADQALYIAKQSGRNQVQIYQDTIILEYPSR